MMMMMMMMMSSLETGRYGCSICLVAHSGQHFCIQAGCKYLSYAIVASYSAIWFNKFLYWGLFSRYLRNVYSTRPIEQQEHRAQLAAESMGHLFKKQVQNRWREGWEMKHLLCKIWNPEWCLLCKKSHGHFFGHDSGMNKNYSSSSSSKHEYDNKYKNPIWHFVSFARAID